MLPLTLGSAILLPAVGSNNCTSERNISILVTFLFACVQSKEPCLSDCHMIYELKAFGYKLLI